VPIAVAPLTSSLNSSNGGYAAAAISGKRQICIQFIRNAGLFDAAIDFAAATFDPRAWEHRVGYRSVSSVGGPGGKLHPDRPGYMAMGLAIDPKMIGGR
jgi:hypothetical protein